MPPTLNLGHLRLVPKPEAPNQAALRDFENMWSFIVDANATAGKIALIHAKVQRYALPKLNDGDSGGYEAIDAIRELAEQIGALYDTLYAATLEAEGLKRCLCEGA